ncbi:MAG: radical SAM protein [Candidatus Thiodiazotropha sp.]
MNSYMTNCDYRDNEKQSSNFSVKICKESPDWIQFGWNNSNKVIYGPVSSRRLGKSLGVNLFPKGKICSFSCTYCDLDTEEIDDSPPKIVQHEHILYAVQKELELFCDTDFPIDSITFAGNGEPTLHPDFARLVEQSASIRDCCLPTIPMNVFTNCMHLHNKDVFESLKYFRRVFLKLDAVTRDIIEKIDGKGSYRGVENAVKIGQKIDNAAISTVVVDGSISNFSNLLSNTYVDYVKTINPKELYFYTLDYPVPIPGIKAVSLDNLSYLGQAIAEKVECSVIVLWRKYQHPSVKLQR